MRARQCKRTESNLGGNRAHVFGASRAGGTKETLKSMTGRSVVRVQSAAEKAAMRNAIPSESSACGPVDPVMKADQAMRAFVIVATKGRAKEVWKLLSYLMRQTVRPEFTVIIGTDLEDIQGLKQHPLVDRGEAAAIVSPRVGLTSQRNHAIDILRQTGAFDDRKGRFFCAFFDDDFRMADDWLARASERLLVGDVVGLTGKILADGVKRGGYTEETAESLLAGHSPPEKHWASGPTEFETDSVYGCNMAFIDTVIRRHRFDENLPLYGWQEDRDYTGQAKKLGAVIYFPGASGVHLGVQSGGRMRGTKFGYSQFANPVYLFKKGTGDYRWSTHFIVRALASNIVHSVISNSGVDYRGRLYGNILAIRDFLLMRLDPRRILSLD